MNNPDPKLTTQTTPATNRRIHPLIATAAGAVIVASLAATAAITGVFPKASSNAEQSAQSQTGQTTVMASQPVVDSTRAAAPAPSAQYAQNTAPAQPTPAQQQQAQAAQAPAAPPPQYAQQPQQYAQEAQPQQPACASCGVVEGISATRQEGHGTGIGAVGGAVAGGVVGNQFGAGGGRTAMTLLGALGGGLAGNSVEKHLRSTTAYSVRVRMDNGKTRYFTYHEAPPFQQGQRVRIEHGTLAAA
ncbi:glycine zipper 2TM domain-containing protein [Burkholderia sp. Ax-1719]|uniref:glycine zipper 2TM domain-containing protein n=1 Tax=Burkholderia sp. Ax-1719 TaxID=2608334 RepID=UPI0014215FC8|nr:glycine zipper 2TM domain-containing protein [Burkholderia sp. Ax-1719]NIE63937.1 glycine zipper 2TM domain-containing protein [Burkholderia sp. Ax-1719]